MANTTNNEAFLLLLDALSSSDKSSRIHADEQINAFKNNDINGVLKLTLSVMLSESNEQRRLQAVVLLRLLLDVTKAGETARNTWKNVATDCKILLKSSLLQCLHNESNSTIRRNACDTISDLCAACLDENEWPDLIMCTMQLVQDQNPIHKKSGLKLLGDCFGYFVDKLSMHVNEVVQLIKQSLMDQDASVRTEAICTISNAIEEDVIDLANRLADTTPLIMDHLKQLTTSQQDALVRDELERSLAGIIMIVDNNAKMLKPHLNLFFNRMLEICMSDSFNGVDSEIKYMAVEALVTLPEKKPKMALTIPNFGVRMVSCLMNCMLDIQDDSYAEWLATGEDDDEVQRLYDAGEEGLDRLGRAFEYIDNCPFMDWVLSNSSHYIQQPHWQHVFVGIMAISQTIEYLPEDELEERMGPIIKIMLEKLKDSDFRVRFAACQTIGQLALDHQPFVQLNFHEEVIPALITTFEDPIPRVQSHALSAFINYAEEVQKEHLMPFSDMLMQRLLSKINVNVKAQVREQAITSIAVTAGVLEENFIKYYSSIIPLMKEIIEKCVAPEERTCRGKAIECISITGMSIGLDVFRQDGIECMNALIQIMKEPSSPDDPVKEYINEALGRLCSALGTHFVPFLPTIVPILLNELDQSLNPSADSNDQTLYMGTEGAGAAGLRTSLVEDQERTLNLISTIVEELKDDYDEYIAPTAKVLMPILSYVLTGDLKQKALGAMANLIMAKRLALDKRGGSRDMLFDIVINTINQVMVSLEKARSGDSGLNIPIDILCAGADGLYKCIDSAGTGVFNANILGTIGTKLLHIINESSKVKAIYKKCKSNKNLDQDDILALEEDEEAEQSFRSSLLEIFGVLMKHHPEEFMATCQQNCMQFILYNLEKSNHPDDIAIALYLCDNMIEFLKYRTVSLWDVFIPHLFKHVENKVANVRQSACFGISLLARLPQFGPHANEAAARIASALHMRFPPSHKDQQAATDNAIAALGDLIINHGMQLSDANNYLQLWLKSLPLKQDETEACRVHADLMELVMANNPSILGADNCNITQLSRIFIAIYQTDFSTDDLNAKIVQLFKHLGQDFLKQLAPSLPRRLQMQLKIIAKAIS